MKIQLPFASFIGAIFALLLSATFTSCTVPMGANDVHILGGTPVLSGGGSFFAGGGVPCGIPQQQVFVDPGCQPVYQQGCAPGQVGYRPGHGGYYGNGHYGQQWGGDGNYPDPNSDYFRRRQQPPLQEAGVDSYGNQLYTDRSWSGHTYLTSDGMVTPPPLSSQNPRGALRYVYFGRPDRQY